MTISRINTQSIFRTESVGKILTSDVANLKLLGSTGIYHPKNSPTKRELQLKYDLTQNVSLNHDEFWGIVVQNNLKMSCKVCWDSINVYQCIIVPYFWVNMVISLSPLMSGWIPSVSENPIEINLWIGESWWITCVSWWNLMKSTIFPLQNHVKVPLKSTPEIHLRLMVDQSPRCEKHGRRPESPWSWWTNDPGSPVLMKISRFVGWT